MELAKHVSPLTYVRRAAPIITVHGDHDLPVPYSQAVRLRDALTHAGVPNELVTIPNGGHGSFSDDQTQKAFERIWDFLDAHDWGPCTAPLRRRDTDGKAPHVSPSIASGDQRDVAISNQNIRQYQRLSLSDQRFLGQLMDLPLWGLCLSRRARRMRAGQVATFAESPVETQEYRTSACTVHLIRPLQAQSPMPITFTCTAVAGCSGPSDPHEAGV